MSQRAGAVLVGLMAAVVAFVVVLAIIVFSLQSTLKANIDSQVPNRVKNVATWCGAINQDRDYSRARAAARKKLDPTVHLYRLRDLDCGVLERKTADSAKK